MRDGTGEQVNGGHPVLLDQHQVSSVVRADMASESSSQTTPGIRLSHTFPVTSWVNRISTTRPATTRSTDTGINTLPIRNGVRERARGGEEHGTPRGDHDPTDLQPRLSESLRRRRRTDVLRRRCLGHADAVPRPAKRSGLPVVGSFPGPRAPTTSS